MNNWALYPVCPLVLSTAMGFKFSVPKETPLVCLRVNLKELKLELKPFNVNLASIYTG